MIPRIDDWFVRPGGNPYTAPEVAGTVVVGRVTGHPDQTGWPNGSKIQTSQIVAFRGRVVTTASGSKYRLGRVNEAYARWWASRARPIDPCRPLRRRS